MLLHVLKQGETLPDEPIPGIAQQVIEDEQEKLQRKAASKNNISFLTHIINRIRTDKEEGESNEQDDEDVQDIERRE